MTDCEDVVIPRYFVNLGELIVGFETVESLLDGIAGHFKPGHGNGIIPQLLVVNVGSNSSKDSILPELGKSVLDDVCEGDDWDEAREAADAAVQADYDDYFETLEAMGVNPKPVC
jgi:hypothetical protein